MMTPITELYGWMQEHCAERLCLKLAGEQPLPEAEELEHESLDRAATRHVTPETIFTLARRSTETVLLKRAARLLIDVQTAMFADPAHEESITVTQDQQQGKACVSQGRKSWLIEEIGWAERLVVVKLKQKMLEARRCCPNDLQEVLTCATSVEMLRMYEQHHIARRSFAPYRAERVLQIRTAPPDPFRL